MGLETIPKVEKILIKARYLLQYAQKFYWDHCKYFCGFESTPKGFRRIEN